MKQQFKINKHLWRTMAIVTALLMIVLLNITYESTTIMIVVVVIMAPLISVMVSIQDLASEYEDWEKAFKKSKRKIVLNKAYNEWMDYNSTLLYLFRKKNS